jgi:acyl transferase domain-containing protein
MTDPGAHVLLLSASSSKALSLEAQQLEQRLGEDLPHLALSLARRPMGEHRLAIVAENQQDLATKLGSARSRLEQPQPRPLRSRSGIYYNFGPRPGKIAVLFPGQGSQYPEMLRELCGHVPGVKTWFDELDRAYLRAGAARPSELLSPARPNQADDDRLFGLEVGAQLGLAASLALYSVLLRMGVRADFLLGHSNGEHAALIAAGVISYASIREACEFMCRVALESTRLPAPPVPEGVMAVGGIDRHVVEAIVNHNPNQIYVAVDNCPTQVVLAGYRDALQKAAAEMRLRGAICSSLPFVRAHHTPLFADWSRLLEKHYQALPGGRPNVTVYSCGTAQPYPSDRQEMWKLLASQWSGCVRFRETIETLYAAGARIFIETGPDNRLSAFVDDTLRNKPHRSLSASVSSRRDLLQLAHLAADLYSAGVPVALGIFYGEPAADLCVASARASVREAVLYEYTTTARIAAESEARMAARVGGRSTRVPAVRQFPLLGEVRFRESGKLLARRTFQIERDAFLLDHRLGRGERGEHGAPLPVLAFTLTTEIAAEAASCLAGMPIQRLTGIRAHTWLALGPDGLTLEVEAEAQEREIHVKIFALSDTKRTLSFEAVCRCGPRTTATRRPDGTFHPTPPSTWSREAFYGGYAFHGPGFQGIEQVDDVGSDRIAAHIQVTELRNLTQTHLQLDPAVLDCAGQLAALWVLEQSGARLGAYPYSQQELEVCSDPRMPGARLVCRGHVRRSQFETLSSDFEILGSDGILIARLQNLEQRLVRLPDSLWNLLFGREPVSTSLDALLTDPTMDWNVLANQSAIWARAVAHLVLPPEELAVWYGRQDGQAVNRLRQMLAAYTSARA